MVDTILKLKEDVPVDKKKKIIIIASVILVLIALITILFACSKNGNDENPVSSTVETTEEPTRIVLPEIEDDEVTTLPEGKLPPNAGNQPEEIEIYTNPVSTTSSKTEITTLEPVTHKLPK